MQALFSGLITNIKGKTKEQWIGVVDKSALFFFAALIFSLPISNAAVESVFGFILLSFIVKAALKRPAPQEIKIFFKNRVNLALLIFYLAIALSLLNSGPLFKKSLRAWLFKWGEGVMLFYCAQVFLKKKHIKFLLAVFFSSSFLIGIDGIYQRIFGIDFLRGFGLSQTNGFIASTATFQHYNDFAAYLVVIFFILLGVFLYLPRGLSAVILFPVLILTLINLSFTYSRGGWVSFVLASILLVVFSKDKRMRLFSSLFLLFSVLIVIILPSVKERFMYIFQPGGDADRFKIWKAVFVMFKESPFLGKGIGLFMDNINRYAKSIYGQYAHNCYLQILAETGLAGLLSFLWFLWLILSRVYRKLAGSFDFLSAGIFFGFLAFLIHSFFDTQLYSLKLSILFWLLASLLAVYINNGSEDNYSSAEIKKNTHKG